MKFKLGSKLYFPFNPSFAWIGSTVTLSPTLNLVISGPTSTTSPENSCPITKGAFSPVYGCGLSTGIKIGPPRYSCKSLPQIPQYFTSILI